MSTMGPLHHSLPEPIVFGFDVITFPKGYCRAGMITDMWSQIPGLTELSYTSHILLKDVGHCDGLRIKTSQYICIYVMHCVLAS